MTRLNGLKKRRSPQVLSRGKMARPCTAPHAASLLLVQSRQDKKGDTTAVLALISLSSFSIILLWVRQTLEALLLLHIRLLIVVSISLKHSEELRWSNPRKAESIASEEILLTFENALRAIRSVLDEHKGRPRTDSFLETVDEGVSFEFARALSQFTSHSESAIRILRQEGSERSAEFAFTPVESPVIEKAANLLALDPEPQDVTLVGEVTLLSRSVAGQDQLIRLNIEEGADVRKARIRLSAEQYEIAMEAHRREASLQVSGRLEKEGKLYWLYEPTNVSIVEGSESELPLREDTSHPTLFEF